jgi:tetratricopeptide (TPR) repeat protein
MVALVGSAYADDKTGKQKQADELFEEGRNLLNAGDQNAAAACAKFNDAIKLDPEAPGTMLNLGLCNEKLNKYKTALYWFRKAQARAAETNLPDYETAAKEHTVDLAGKVATIKIAFTGAAPEGTKVKIDNQEVAPADSLSAEVDPGAHTLVAGAPGHKIFTQQFTVVGRGGETLTIDLVRGDNSVVVDPGAGRRKAAIITASAGSALLVGSLVVSLVAQSRYGRCAKDGDLLSLTVPDADGDLRSSSCPAGDQAATDYANKYQRLAQVWGTSLFVAGSVTVAVAAYLYFTAPEKERVDRTVFMPSIGPDQVGFAISRGF